MSKPYVVDNTKWYGDVNLMRRLAAQGFCKHVPPANGLEKRAAGHFKTFERLKAVHCRPPAFPEIVTDKSLGEWFRAMKDMVRRATGPRSVAIQSALQSQNGAQR